MKISVIIPVYNCESFLEACLDSVLNQTYQNFEIILVNDGSGDRSGEICDRYAARDSRIRVIHQENHGVSHARNQGLQLITGDAVSFIDSDDTLEPNMYELLVKVMQEHDADIAHCGYKHIVRDEIRLVHDTRRIIVQTSEEALECFVAGRLFGGGLWSKLFRTEVIQDLRFREDLKINEDILFNFQAFRKVNKSVFADYALYNYIAHFGTSAVFRTPSGKKIADACQVSEYIYRQLSGSALHDIAAERYIRSLRGYYQYCAKYDTSLCRSIASTMVEVASGTKNLGRNMAVTVQMIRFCPWLYRIVYGAYSKIRKPRWEARKD